MQTFVLFLSLVLNLALYVAGAQLAGWHSIQTMAALAVLNFVAILLHELGHAWGFRHVGGRVHKVVVLFLAYDVAKRRFARSRLSAGGDVGGYVAGSFRPEGPTIRDQIIVSGAGPAANLVTGALAALAAVLIGPAVPPWLGMGASGPAEAVAPLPEGGLPPSPIAMLPSEAEVTAVLAQFDAATRAFEWHQMGYAVLVLFATLSIGLALLNLLPYGGSDGQKIARALKMWRAVRGR
jgi:membrane-associated protease RseP (regulator of RpoE activity)